MKTEAPDQGLLRLAEEAIARLGTEPSAGDDVERAEIAAVLADLTARLEDNYPYHQPLYAGQMLKPPHAVAWLAYLVAQTINPNNHALDGGRATSALERECVAQIGQLYGWSGALGHLTSGGTMANLEALWMARCLHPERLIVASTYAHYTHERIAGVVGARFQAIPGDSDGRMDLDALEGALRRGDVGTVVVTLGTTALGAVDPLPDILALRERHGFRIHVDAAYGGYFRLCPGLHERADAAFAAATHADSVVIDPHKHGLQPYGCGCVLFRDPAVGRFYKHDSPYTYFSSAELHLGEISLECSRPGAAAAALWATMRLYPLTPGGRFARRLAQCRAAALALHARIQGEPRLFALLDPELDIVVFAPSGRRASEVSRRSREIFARAAEAGLHLALARVSGRLADRLSDRLEMDEDAVTMLRSCLMKPEHLAAMDTIWAHLLAALDRAG